MAAASPVPSSVRHSSRSIRLKAGRDDAIRSLCDPYPSHGAGQERPLFAGPAFSGRLFADSSPGPVAAGPPPKASSRPDPMGAFPTR